MKQLFLITTLFLFACAPDRGVVVPDTPETPDPPTPDPEPAPNADGDYILYTTVSTQYCGDETDVIDDFIIGNSDLILQNSPDIYDFATPYDGFLTYDLEDKKRSVEDGAFSEENWGYVYIWPGFPPAIWKRWLDGHIWDSIDFTYAFELGDQNDEGDFVPYCRFDADVVSERRYALRSDAPRTGIGGKWRTKKTILYDSWADDSSAKMQSGPPPEAPALLAKHATGSGFQNLRAETFLSPMGSFTKRSETSHLSAEADSDARYITLNIVPHDDDGSWFTIRGTYFGFDPLRTADGEVDVFIWYNTGMLTTLTGSVTDEALDLEFYWRWYDPITDETHRELRIRYEGVPRYDQPVAPQNIFGEYISTFRIIEDTCEGSMGQWARVTDTLPSSDGKVRLGLTGRYSEPNLDLPLTGGVFSYGFTTTWNKEVRYQIDGAISPYFLDATIRIDVHSLTSDNAEVSLCHVIYKVENGTKRFRAFDEQAP